MWVCVCVFPYIYIYIYMSVCVCVCVCVCVFPLDESHPSAGIRSVYAAVPADWATGRSLDESIDRTISVLLVLWHINFFGLFNANSISYK